MARNPPPHPGPPPQGGRESDRKKAADPVQPEIPIQPVSRPILCSPYLEPDRHWVYDTQTGDAREEAGRRPASYWYRTQRTGSAQRSLLAEEERDDLPLVNLLREDVRRWRESNYRNATPVTRQLLAHWGRTDRPRRLFFCQLEAVETVIYLNEILASGHKTGFTPRLSPQDYQALMAGDRPSFITESQPKVFPTLSDPPNPSINMNPPPPTPSHEGRGSILPPPWRGKFGWGGKSNSLPLVGEVRGGGGKSNSLPWWGRAGERGLYCAMAAKWRRAAAKRW